MAIATKTTGFLLLSRCPFLYLPLFSAFSASLPFSRPIPSLYWTAWQPDQLISPPTPPTDHTVSRDDQQGELVSDVDHQLMSVKGDSYNKYFLSSTCFWAVPQGPYWRRGKHVFAPESLLFGLNPERLPPSWPRGMPAKHPLVAGTVPRAFAAAAWGG